MLCQLITLSDYNDSSNIDRQMVDALENDTAHVIDRKLELDADNDFTDGFLSRLDTINDTEELAIFTAILQETDTLRALTVNMPPRRYADLFNGAMVRTGSVRRSSGGHAQYLEY